MRCRCSFTDRALKASNWHRTSRASRGYGPAWDKLRVQVLKRDGYLCQCRHCAAEDRPTLANEVDHIVPKAQGGTDDMRNLQAINSDCHKRKTAEDEGRAHHERIVYGLDGYPVSR